MLHDHLGDIAQQVERLLALPERAGVGQEGAETNCERRYHYTDDVPAEETL